jgi:hypothetical protein
MVIGQQLGVNTIPDPLQESRRALDVGEQECQCLHEQSVKGLDPYSEALISGPLRPKPFGVPPITLHEAMKAKLDDVGLKWDPAPESVAHRVAEAARPDYRYAFS